MERNHDLEVTCKRHRFGYWNLCKCLPNFVNVAALEDRLSQIAPHIIGSALFLCKIVMFESGDC